jgi:2-iminobutanoate/2-iminopropanoate deaminase
MPSERFSDPDQQGRAQVTKEQIRSQDAPPPAGVYSQAIRVGNLVFLAGQGPLLPNGEMVEGGFEEQARQTLENLAAVAEAAGGSLADAVRVGVFLRDMANFPAMNEIYRGFFPEPYPARTTVQSNLPGFEIEVDAVLWLGGE